MIDICITNLGIWKMARVALVPMAAKPYHAGHDGLVRIASNECDEVRLFVSIGDRVRPGEFPIYGSDMISIWNQFIEPSLPANVEIIYCNVPVKEVYATLEEAEQTGDTTTTFVIYSGGGDILKYSDLVLAKNAPTIFENQQIERRGVNRNETVNISGTKMRNLIAMGDIDTFVTLLPPAIQNHGKEIFDILVHNTKKKTATESLLRSYIRLFAS
jgi:ATP sulfurylase